MQVIVPYSECRRDTVNNLIAPLIKREHNDVEFIKLASEDDAYWKLMCEIWERRELVVINEHDILPYPTAIQALLDCPYHWCSYTYEMKGGYGIHHGLGCTKLDSQFMDKFPDAWVNMDSTHWQHLDAQLAQMARAEQVYPAPPFSASDTPKGDMRRVAKHKQAAHHAFYNYTKPAWLRSHPSCEVCGSYEGVTIHHKMRRGKYLNDSNFFMTVCIVCHEWIESHKRQARDKGWILYK